MEIVQRLLDHGANVNAPNADGAFPLDLAVHKGRTDIVRGSDRERRECQHKPNGWFD